MDQTVSQSRSFFESSCTLTGRLLIGISGFLYVLTGLLFVGFLGTSIWESLVWLFNTNWRSSQFEIPGYLLISIICAGLAAYILYLFGRGLRLSGRDNDSDINSAGYYLMLLVTTTAMAIIVFLVIP